MASELARRLTACYPDLKPSDPKIYAVSLAKLFASYPESIGKRVVDPINGLPGRLKFSPKIADVRNALEDEASKRRIIRANALWMNQERERRADEARKAFEFNRARPGSEERRKQVQAALATLKPLKGENP